MRLAVVWCVIGLATIAHAAPHHAPPVIVAPPISYDTPAVARVLYLDRCASNCTVVTNGNDATSNSSTIPMGKAGYSLTAFAFGDEDWNAIVKCVKDVYSPYDIEVTDQAPASGTLFNKTFVAGLPSEIGQAGDVLGIAPLAANCSPLSNNVAFAFANQHTPTDRNNNICWTVAQESAHMYGLDHEYQFVPELTSACNDPMTYRTDCGGEKFFRDRDAMCGDFSLRDCKCKRTTQNSHDLLRKLLGEGTPSTAAPTATIKVPAAGGIPITKGYVVQAEGAAQRGVAEMQLVLNGHVWVSVPGTGFGPTGQPTIVYALQFPGNVPQGVVDIQIRAIDDLGAAFTTAPITVQLGPSCVDESTCLTGQHCSTGRCAWDPPVAQAGDACGFNEACISNACQDGTCVQPCDATRTDPKCPSDQVCAASGTITVCQNPGGGCCSTSHGGAPQAFLAMFGLGVLLRRRRR